MYMWCMYIHSNYVCDLRDGLVVTLISLLVREAALLSGKSLEYSSVTLFPATTTKMYVVTGESPVTVTLVRVILDMGS